jgi:hypothetical protein
MRSTAVILLCFDVDGTLDCSGGPVPVRLLESLHAAGVALFIVSPSGAYQGNLPRQSDLPTREANLLAAHDRAADAFRQAAVRLYVSDNKDYAQASAAGFCYIEASDFAKGIGD